MRACIAECRCIIEIGPGREVGLYTGDLAQKYLIILAAGNECLWRSFHICDKWRV